MEPPAANGRELDVLWPAILDSLAPNQRVWLASSKPVMLAESTAVIAVPNEFTRTQLEGRLRTRLEDALSDSLNRPIRIAVSVDETLAPPEGSPEAGVPSAPDQAMTRSDSTGPGMAGHGMSGFVTQPHQQAPMETRQQSDLSTNIQMGAASLTTGIPDSPLNPRYTFETFVIGSSNRFAHAAAVAVAEAPGKAYNPLLVYGDSGLGKTHLLHAIGHYVRSLYTGAKIRYVSSEAFTNDVINAIKDANTAALQRRYRDVDVLLIDDIQFLEGKQQTQEEFFHTFNTLHNANKQIVISSDRPPKRLTQLEDRLRNRFEWGLLTDVQPPDLETRIAILRKKAAADRLHAPADVLEFIASRIQTNIRELEGALIRVTAFASINHQEVDLTLAEIVLKDLIPEGGEPQVTAGLIIAQTASYHSFSIEDLCGPSRTRALVTARQIAMYLCRELTDLSLPKIGQQFGGRDHTTVMNAERRIRKDLAERQTVYKTVNELTMRIKQQAKQA
ncbi:chromosomal replication initiator protein DnaA [Marmoricola pocheonensis]|uniref:Chromosomal replication initiator protein DnaA n=1 Tax=Nocardioides pocheonensis TaxID=661485 RepID=A0A3N0GK96_9ACTN|nr:chromosomal replication initiator protein DnaA [Nocardioides pocheonensis]